MSDHLENEELEAFSGFGKDGNESRLEFVKDFNDLLCDYLAISSDKDEKLDVADFVSTEIAILLSAPEEDVETEGTVVEAFDCLLESFEKMLDREYKHFLEHTDKELLDEVMEEAKKYLDTFDPEDTMNRLICILMLAKEKSEPCGCGCHGDHDHSEE